MSSINGKSENLYFQGRIKEIEQEIVEFQLNLARSNNQSESLQKILSTLLLHGKLTQSQIKKLAILSKSTISTGLLNLLNIGHIKKEKIQGSREYAYYISSTFKESMFNALGSLDNEIKFLEIKQKELVNNYSPKCIGYNLLTNRINELIYVFGLYQKVVEKLEDDTIEIKTKDIAIDLTKEDLRNIDVVIDPEIKQIEDKIIDYFLYSSAYSTLDELTNRVYIYFFTRKVLTQKKLRYLTGLSLGKISQIVKQLIDVDTIEKLNKNENRTIIPADMKRQQIYTMISIQRSFFKSGLTSGKKILKNKSRFQELMSELVAYEAELKTLNGYDKVLEVLKNYFRLFMIFDKIEQIFKTLI